MSKLLKSIGRAASSVAKAATPVEKIAVPIAITSILTDCTIKSLAVDTVKKLR